MTASRGAVRTAVFTCILVLLGRLASACPVCFGAADGPMQRGTNVGILALLVVTVAMLGAFATFGLYLIKRAHHADAARPAEERVQ